MNLTIITAAVLSLQIVQHQKFPQIQTYLKYYLFYSTESVQDSTNYSIYIHITLSSKTEVLALGEATIE